MRFTTVQSMVAERPIRSWFWKVNSMQVPIQGKNHHRFLSRYELIHFGKQTIRLLTGSDEGKSS